MLFLHRAKLKNSSTSTTPLQIVIWVEKTNYLCPPPPPPIWVPCLGAAFFISRFSFLLERNVNLRSSCRLKIFYTWSIPFLWNKLSISLTHSKRTGHCQIPAIESHFPSPYAHELVAHTHTHTHTSSCLHAKTIIGMVLVLFTAFGYLAAKYVFFFLMFVLSFCQ